MRRSYLTICALSIALSFAPLETPAAELEGDRGPAAILLGKARLLLPGNSGNQLHQPTWLTRFAASPFLPNSTVNAASLPSDLIHVCISRDALAAERDVDCSTPVTDYILDTQVTGTAHTRATSQLRMHPSEKEAVAELFVTGTVESVNRGDHSRVVLHGTSRTTFESRKRLIFDEQGIRTLPATTICQTESTTDRVQPRAGGIRGQVAQRVGERRAEELRDETNEIISRHTEDKINRDIDQKIDRSLHRFQSLIAAHLTRLTYGHDRLAPRIRVRATADYLEMVVGRSDIPGQSGFAEAASAGPGISARLHRTVVVRMLTDSTIRSAILPLLSELGPDTAGVPQVTTGDSDGPKSEISRFEWSGDQQWLIVEYGHADPNGSETAAPIISQDDIRIAGESAPTMAPDMPD